MWSPRAVEHSGPGNRPKGTDQSIQEAFHWETRNNCRGWQEGIKNKPIHWTAVAFMKGVCLSSVLVSLCYHFWNVQPSSEHLDAGVLYYQSHWDQYRSSHREVKAWSSLLIKDHTALLAKLALWTSALASLKGKQPIAAAAASLGKQKAFFPLSHPRLSPQGVGCSNWTWVMLQQQN